MPEGGTLTVRATSGDPEAGVAIDFIDTGQGIGPRDLERIWEPFYTSKAEGKGTGLGLPICRRIVEDHGGTIGIDSKVGEGTTVSVVLPAANNGVSSATREQVASSVAGAGSETAAAETRFGHIGGAGQ